MYLARSFPLIKPASFHLPTDALGEASYILQCIYVIPASIASIACGSIAESACGCKMLAESACPEAFRFDESNEFLATGATVSLKTCLERFRSFDSFCRAIPHQ